ncbi:MAG: AMP-binding protein, partial [bacterium]|nr:AMP-binding protein [bacterium]
MKLKPYEIGTHTAKFDLTLKGTEKDGGLYFYFEYNTKLFKESTIDRFVTYFENVMTGILEKPGATLSEISIITQEEKEQLLREFSKTGTGKPHEAKTIGQLFEEQVAREPENRAAVYEAEYITYTCLNRKARRLARILKEKGIGPGRMAALMTVRSIEMIVGIMGIIKAGGAYLPLEPASPPERIRYILEDSRARVLMTYGQENPL